MERQSLRAKPPLTTETEKPFAFLKFFSKQQIKAQIQCGIWMRPYKTFFMLQVSKKSFQSGKSLKTNFHVTAESPFHFHWYATFKKDRSKRQPGFCCASEAEITVESPFHFHWHATFKKIAKRDSQVFAVQAKPKSRLKVLFIFIELWLSKRSLKGAMWISL